MDNLLFVNDWVLFLDADEKVSPGLKEEICYKLKDVKNDVNGYYIKRRFIFLSRWIRHGGYYPTYILRLFRHSLARCEECGVNEHFFVPGKTANLQCDIIHQDNKGINAWIERHNYFATLEAVEIMKSTKIHSQTEKVQIDVSLFGHQVERKRWIKEKVWKHLPLLLRSFIYFFYRYFLRLGFLDGKEGFIYHFLQGLWFPFLIDVKYLEIKMLNNKRKMN